MKYFARPASSGIVSSLFPVTPLTSRQELIDNVGSEETPPETRASGIEDALRYLGRQTHGIPVEILEHALDEPDGAIGLALASLTNPLGLLAEWTAKERALAVWALLEEGVKHRSVSPTPHSRQRYVLSAAFRLSIDGISSDSWGASLRSRFKQLKTLSTAFGSPSTTQPMESAWSAGVKALAACVNRQFDVLTSIEDWERYRPRDTPTRDLGEWIVEHDDRVTRERTILRRASDHAQKVFAELIVVTVHMRARSVHRRVTERLITSRDPGDLQYYTASGYRVRDDDISRAYVPVRSVWGCREQIMEPQRLGHVPVTRLWFPNPLKFGEQAYFASEAVFDQGSDSGDGSFWVDVEIDHLGIARGRLLYGQKLPIRGLTIRIKFDDSALPEAVWWYAELTADERWEQPPAGHRRLLPLVGNAVQHTFTEHVCQPREHYGLAFNWPVKN